MGKYVLVLPSWAAAFLAGLAGFLIIAFIPAVRHMALGVGILCSYLASKYHSKQQHYWDPAQSISTPESDWLESKSLELGSLVQKQSADFGQHNMAVRIVTNQRGLSNIFAELDWGYRLNVSAKALVVLSPEELAFLTANALLFGRTSYFHRFVTTSTGLGLLLLLYLSVYINIGNVRVFSVEAVLMLVLISLVWWIYGKAMRRINNRREVAINAGIRYTGNPCAAASAALLSSSFVDIPDGTKLKLQEIRRMGYVPPEDVDLDWLQDR